MSKTSMWTRRKVQGVGSNSYRMSIPREFAEGEDEVEYTQTGDFLIARPADYNEGEKTERVTFPEDLRGEDDQKRYHSIVGNILQSLCIASVDKIEVVFPDDLSDTEFDNYDHAWYTQREYAPGSLEWFLEDEKMLIKDGVEFRTFINDVSRYIGRNLVRPLKKSSRPVFYDNSKFEENPHGFGVVSPNLDQEEGKIDTRWALATRNIGEMFYNLNREKFAKGVCGIYLGKYLEMAIDITKRLIESLATFEKKFPDLSEFMIKDMKYIFTRKEVTRFDERIRNTAKNSYSLNATNEDFLIESDKNWRDQEVVNDYRNECLKSADFDVDNPMEAGLLYGQILTFCERLLRFPRSLCHVGVGARNVDNVH